jgi:hypothetical protein
MSDSLTAGSTQSEWHLHALQKTIPFHQNPGLLTATCQFYMIQQPDKYIKKQWLNKKRGYLI